MAQVLADTKNNLFFYIYSNDHTPAHVHVFVGPKRGGAKYIKINIGNSETAPEILQVSRGVKNADITRAWHLVAEYQEELLKKWNEIHGPQKQPRSSKRKTSK